MNFVCLIVVVEYLEIPSIINLLVFVILYRHKDRYFRNLLTLKQSTSLRILVQSLLFIVK